MFLIFAQGANVSTLNVDAFFDYTSGVQAIISQTESNLPNSVSQCCKYRYQILDQYCATQTVVRNTMVMLQSPQFFIFNLYAV